MLDQILLHFLIRFEDVDCEHDQTFSTELPGDVIHQGCFFLAVLAPGRPELEKNDFALDGLVVELLSGRGLGAEARGGFAGRIPGLGVAEGSKDGQKQEAGGEARRIRASPDKIAPKHGGEYSTGVFKKCSRLLDYKTPDFTFAAPLRHSVEYYCGPKYCTWTYVPSLTL